MPERPLVSVTIATWCALLLVGCPGGVTEPPVVVWEATLARTGAGPGPRGSLVAISEGSNTRTSIRIEAGEAGATYGWRIRPGRCEPSGTGQVGGRAAYPDAVADETGTAVAEGTIARLLLSSERYHAVIVDPADETRTLACGPLQRGRL